MGYHFHKNFCFTMHMLRMMSPPSTLPIKVCPGEAAQFTVQLGACGIAETRRGIRASQEECRGSSTKFRVWRASLIWSGQATVRIAHLQSPWDLYRIKDRKLLSDAGDTVLEVVVEIEENMAFPRLQGQSLETLLAFWQQIHTD